MFYYVHLLFQTSVLCNNAALETTCLSWLIGLLESTKLTTAPKVSLSTREVLWSVERLLEVFAQLLLLAVYQCFVLSSLDVGKNILGACRFQLCI